MSGSLQTFDNLKVKGVDIPVEVTIHLYEIVVKARQFLKNNPSIGQPANNGATAGCPKVNSKEILIAHIT